MERMWYLLGSFDRSAVSLRNLKIIFKLQLTIIVIYEVQNLWPLYAVSNKIFINSYHMVVTYTML